MWPLKKKKKPKKRKPKYTTTGRQRTAVSRIGQPPTRRELEITEMITDGLSNAEIGALLYLGEETVKSHVRRILLKANARNRTHLVKVAYQEGWLTMPSLNRSSSPSRQPTSGSDDE